MRWLVFPALVLAVAACHKSSPAPAASQPASPAKPATGAAPTASAPAAPTPAPAEPAAPALAVGSEAPDFALPGTDGKVHKLSDDRGKRAVVLAWYPKAFTGG